jgi:hypothetical protein
MLRSLVLVLVVAISVQAFVLRNVIQHRVTSRCHLSMVRVQRRDVSLTYLKQREYVHHHVHDSRGRLASILYLSGSYPLFVVRITDESDCLGGEVLR